MLVYKCLLPFLIVLFVQGAYSKPTENELTKGRGIGSTLWDWITYPFTGWWGSDEVPPVPDHLVAPTVGPYDNFIISSRNVTILCNEHTCTTIKCDINGCVNTTCNMYDTDVTGQCREYNTGLKPEEPKPSNPTETVPKPSTGAQEPVPLPQGTTTPVPSAQTEPPVEHPLQLEEALSATVAKKSAEATPSDNKLGKSSPQNKI